MPPDAAPGLTRPDVGTAPLSRRSLGVMTGAKWVANVGIRWVGPFLPTLERAFSTSTGALTTAIGIGELGGLSTLVTAQRLDRVDERRVVIAGLGLVTVSSVLALVGHVVAFGAAFMVLVIGVANLTVAGHAWIARHVPYRGRARAIGIFETSWAFALLVGAPILAIAIDLVGWRGPFVLIAAGAAAAAILVARLVPADPPRTADGSPADAIEQRLPRTAWAPLLGSAATAAAGLSVFVVMGAWLDDRFGVTASGLGAIAVLIGALELVASTASAAIADRVGKRRSVAAGLVVLVGGLVVIASAASVAVAVIGLTVFLTGFEFAFVTSLSLVSEAAPASRGRALGVGNSIGTVARAGAVTTAGVLYDRSGIGAAALFSALCAVVALGLLAMTRFPDQHARA